MGVPHNVALTVLVGKPALFGAAPHHVRTTQTAQL